MYSNIRGFLYSHSIRAATNGYLAMRPIADSKKGRRALENQNLSLVTVAVISDIHGNAVALEAVLNEPEVARADLIVVGGDHAAGPQPLEVLEQLRALEDRAVLLRGNADREMVSAISNSRIDDIPDVSLWAASQMTDSDVALLTSLPHPLKLTVPGFGSVLFCHGSPRHEDDVVLVDSRLERWEEVFAGLDPAVAMVVGGHTHMPFMRLVDSRIVLNPGSVGMPYGRPGPSWLVLTDGSIKFGHTPMDAGDMARKLIAGSAYPAIDEWVRDYVLEPASDIDALTAFGPMDGRQ